MTDVFIKKYWDEEETLFYLHFQNGFAVRQIEISPKGKLYLSSESPTSDSSMLYDQSLEELELDASDYITKDEFEIVWKNQ